jgi:hypothetical protein
MFRYVGLWLSLLTRCLQSHRSLLLENLALRQQLAVLKRKHPRPRMGTVDKIFWVFARRFWSAWKQSLVLVNPETVVRWHRRFAYSAAIGQIVLNEGERKRAVFALTFMHS